MGNVYIFSRYNPPPQVGHRNDEPTMTQQHFQDECDINTILAKFVKTGILDNIGPGVYADLGNATDYLTSLETVRRAREIFEELPSHIRKEFGNDPARYLDFVYDPANEEKGIELGLFNKKQTSFAEPKDSQKRGENDQNPAG